MIERLADDARRIEAGGGDRAIAAQHVKGRMTARERIATLLDADSAWFELNLFAGEGMYDDWGGAPSAGVVTGLGTVGGRRFVIIANDATVKAGAFFPQTAKKVLRAQRIATDNRLPLIYLVDSAGVFLPLQDDVFPDEDDFGRIFRNNAVISAMGIPQYAAIMGNCVAGGGYLPVLCDKLLMTEGSGLYLAGPALVKAAIGQDVSHEDLGGATMHSEISGTIDFHEPDEKTCLDRLRRLAGNLPRDTTAACFDRIESCASARSPNDLCDIVPADGQGEYDMRDVLTCVLDDAPFDEYKARYGKTVITGVGRLGGFAVGVVANQRERTRPTNGPLQFGGVLYHDSADKAARFIMSCNQERVPLIFLQDVNGFMVGRDAEQGGIIRAGAKLVNVVSNSVVPKITVIVGGSFGAGNYAMCGKAFDPRFIFAWPSARYAVMGAAQAADTLLEIQRKALERDGHAVDQEELATLRDRVRDSYEQQTDVRYAAARGWVDRIIAPADTRDALITALESATRHDDGRPFNTGVLQV
jgi:acetyl-CoA carboxylase carboxyltransferase component